MTLKTFAYIDGFNLFYRALKGTPFKWLDVNALLSLVYPRNTFEKIRYFTARVKPLPSDLDQPDRQNIYLRALKTLPNLEIHFGQFTSHPVRLPTVASLGAKRPEFVEVVRSEEKGSDVNLAAHLVHDAHVGCFDVAIVVTNDSDLIEPIRLVRNEIRLPVGVLNPCSQAAGGLKRAATFYKELRASVPGKCQFPDPLAAGQALIRKPPSW